MKYVVLTVVSMKKMTVFWNVVPCSIVDVANICFSGA
jgi:hypothetical protein